MAEQLDYTGANSKLNEIVADIESFGKFISDISEHMRNVIGPESHGSLRGNGASSLRSSWESALEAASQYESVLRSWVFDIKTQIGYFEQMDNNIKSSFNAMDMIKVADWNQKYKSANKDAVENTKDTV